ncbi:MAG: hypothetical protein ACI91J_000710, partial [Yoonia sp.]
GNKIMRGESTACTSNSQSEIDFGMPLRSVGGWLHTLLCA